MSDTNNSGKKRETRTNHAAAKAHPITDEASAQAYADAVREDTKNDKSSSTMFNGSGFVAPTVLDRQDVENRERMGVSIIDSLAASVEQDGANGQRARQALTLLAAYANGAGERREEAKNARIIAAADAIRAKQRGAKAH